VPHSEIQTNRAWNFLFVLCPLHFVSDWYKPNFTFTCGQTNKWESMTHNPLSEIPGYTVSY